MTMTSISQPHLRPPLVLAILLLVFHPASLFAEQEYHRKELEPLSKELAPMLKSSQGAEHFINYITQLADQETVDMALVALTREVAKKKKGLEPGEQFRVLEDMVDGLIARGDPESAVLAADLLFKSVDVPENGGWSTKLEDYPDTLCDRAAALLKHPNPVVQALADWTLQMRIGKQDVVENWADRLWKPGPSAIDWYTAWNERPADLRLSDDYGRQLVHVNRHRTLEALSAEIQKQETRMQALLAAPGSDKSAAESAANLYGQALANARKAIDSGNLTFAHQAYIALRKAGRNLIANLRAEFPHEGFVFHTGYVIPGGSNNVNGAVIGNDLPFGDIYIKKSADPAAPAQSLLGDKLGNGSLHGIDLHWDSSRILFSLWHKEFGEKLVRGYEKKNACIYEMDIAGGEIKQITNPVGANDIEPIFLPDGGYIFASDRSSFGNQCAGAFLQDKRCTTLYRLDPDRADVPIAISNNKDFDRFPAVLNDGMIAFLHWEYQERHFYNLHTVWRCRPDGTNMDAMYKQHINIPMSIRTVRSVPGSPLCVGTAQGHHDGHYGPVVVFDPTQGINNEEAMLNVTPGVSSVEGGLGPLTTQIVPEGGVENRGGRYINPFAMSEKAFLVGHEMTGDKTCFALYYIDVWGNRELLHRDRRMSCFQPFALRPREMPPAIADTVKKDADYATVFVEDVYRDLPGVEPGAVKYLRISQRLFLPSPVYEGELNDVNHLHYLPGVSTGAHFSYWNWAPTRTVGIVHVEEDGSAFFKVPAATPIFLQALDENFCEVRRMRTSFTMQRGEFRSCMGCHESRLETPGRRPVYPEYTLNKGPQTPEPPSWGENTVMDYQEHIQPIFDKHCTACHGEKNPAGGLEFTNREIGGFMQSYRTLFGLKPTDPTPIQNLKYHKPLHPNIEDFPLVVDKEANNINRQMQQNEYPGQLVSISNRHDKAEITMPYQFGSNKSKLIRTLLDDKEHREKVKAKMTEEEWLMLVTFVDHNAVYHGTVIDKSQYGEDGSLHRIEFHLPSPWEPTDTMPSFYNDAELAVSD